MVIPISLDFYQRPSLSFGEPLGVGRQVPRAVQDRPAERSGNRAELEGGHAVKPNIKSLRQQHDKILMDGWEAGEDITVIGDRIIFLFMPFLKPSGKKP